MVAQIKMKLGMQVGLGPGHSVLDGDPAPPPQNGHSPHTIFGPYVLLPNGCMDQDATWYGARPQPRRLCQMGTPLYPPQKGGRAPFQNFWPMFIIVIVISLEHCTMRSLFQYKYTVHSCTT